jgi:hypothetical protein
VNIGAKIDSKIRADDKSHYEHSRWYKSGPQKNEVLEYLQKWSSARNDTRIKRKSTDKTPVKPKTPRLATKNAERINNTFDPWDVKNETNDDIDILNIDSDDNEIGKVKHISRILIKIYKKYNVEIVCVKLKLGCHTK